MIIDILIYVGVAAAAYLIGGFSTAYVVGMIAEKMDIRNYGSGNAGFSNMLRTRGWGLALPTLVGDALKGFIIVWLARLFSQQGIFPPYASFVAAFFVVAGHNWPVFLSFRGGKGIATTFGLTFALFPAWWNPLVGLGLFTVVVLLTSYMSVGALAGSLFMPAAALWFSPGDTPLLATMIVIMLMNIYQLRSNIIRLCKGEEKKITVGKALKKK